MKILDLCKNSLKRRIIFYKNFIIKVLVEAEGFRVTSFGNGKWPGEGDFVYWKANRLLKKRKIRQRVKFYRFLLLSGTG